MIIAVLPDDQPALGVLAFGLAGLGCSALLPLTISFGQEELRAGAATVANTPDGFSRPLPASIRHASTESES